MRSVFMSLMMSSFLVAVSACAVEQGEELEEVADSELQDDSELTTFAAQPEEEGSGSAEGEEPSDGPTTKRITYYDDCEEVHQECTCQNTGWAGFCQLQLKNYPNDWVMLCNCD